MKLSSALLLSPFLHTTVAQNQFDALPHISDIIEAAYPTWCIDASETRITDVDKCEDGTPNGKWSPLYFTKKYSGADPKYGGYPSNIDINYAFEFAAPYYGQACAGSPHHCSEDFDGSTTSCKACPKLTTGTDDRGPYGPGHVPPHISLAAVVKAYETGDMGDVKDWFQYDLHACRINPSVLYNIIRKYYPRDQDGKAYYPPPFSPLGGAYPLEFVNLAGDSCEKEAVKHSKAGALDCFEQHSGDVDQYPSYLEVGHGSPHYCTKEGKAADVNNDYCPYIFFGSNRGKYRHPHIAFSAVETYLANKVIGEFCGTTWDDSNYPAEVDTTVAFPAMEGGFPVVVGRDLRKNRSLVSGLEAPMQPTIKDNKWIWPGPEGTKKKAVKGNFATELHIGTANLLSLSNVPGGKNLGRCEGDCDKDKDCKGALVCFQRQDKASIDPVPGCKGYGKPGDDYCTDRPSDTYLALTGDEGIPTTAYPLGICEGDCGKEKEPCGEGLCCFKRRGFTPVPGCDGEGARGKDYCIDKSLGQCN